jgi:hypothetical protein
MAFSSFFFRTIQRDSKMSSWHGDVRQLIMIRRVRQQLGHVPANKSQINQKNFLIIIIACGYGIGKSINRR